MIAVQVKRHLTNPTHGCHFKDFRVSSFEIFCGQRNSYCSLLYTSRVRTDVRVPDDSDIYSFLRPDEWRRTMLQAY